MFYNLSYDFHLNFRLNKTRTSFSMTCDVNDSNQIWFMEGEAICGIHARNGRQFCWESKGNPEGRPKTVILYEMKNNKVSRFGKFTFHQNSGALQVGNYEKAQLSVVQGARMLNLMMAPAYVNLVGAEVRAMPSSES